MRKFLVASHGHFAKGLVETVHYFTGERQDLEFMCLYLDDKDPDLEIKKYIDLQKQEDEIIIFTDLLGGSVNAKFIKYIDRPHTHVITGSNVALVLEMLFLPEGYLENSLIEAMVKNSKDSIQYMNNYQIVENNDDEL